MNGGLVASRVALVTGGGSGIGEAICHELARRGMKVAVLDVNAEAAQRVSAELRTGGASAIAVGADVTDRHAVERAFAQVRTELGPVSVLVTSAGLFGFAPFLEITERDWTRIVEVNLTGTFHCCQVALPDMVAAELTEPIHLAVSYDEEVGCIGGDQIVKDIAELGLTPRACIVGEPTSMQVIRGHKSINLGKVTFRGKAAHSSLTPEGVNAIDYAAKFVVFLRGIADQWRAEGPFDEAYPIPHSTLSTNIIHGGIAGNTVPDRCVVEFEFRGLAELDAPATMQRIEAYARELEQQMKAENEIAGVDFEVPAMVPGLETPADAEAISLGAALGGVRSDGKVTYGTEAGQFSGAGIETVVCGPGDIAQAHTADEYVDLAQLQACEEFIQRLISHLNKEKS